MSLPTLFTVQIEDAEGAKCNQPLTINVASAGFWYDLVWAPPTEPIGTFAHDQFSINAAGDIIAGCTGHRSYQGPTFNSNLHLNITAMVDCALDVNVRWGFPTPDNPIYFTTILAAGVYDLPFTIPPFGFITTLWIIISVDMEPGSITATGLLTP